MRCPRSFSLALAAAALALCGCSYGDNLLDRVTGTDAPTNSSSSTSYQIAASAAESNPSPTITATPLASPAGSSASASAASAGLTFVGQKAQILRGELAQLQSRIAQRQQALAATRQSLTGYASSYYGSIAAINTRLQAGTTPGNPQLMAQWGQAQATLDQMGAGAARLNALGNDVASDSSFGNYLLNEVRSAYTLQGGVESDRDQLKQIEAQTTQALATIDQMLNGLSDEIARQTGDVARERSNLATLALAIQNGQLYGPSLANRSFANVPVTPGPVTSGSAAARAESPRNLAPSRSSASDAPPPSASGRPLVIIRFDQPNVSYEQPLYSAVSRALERKPSATFTIEAVAPNGGSAAEVALNTNASRQNAENVLRSLTTMGLPADRVSLSATMSPDVRSNEVRIYVR